MKKFRIDIILKCGRDVVGFFKTKDLNPIEISKLIKETNQDEFISLTSRDGNTIIEIKKEEVAAFKIEGRNYEN